MESRCYLFFNVDTFRCTRHDALIPPPWKNLFYNSLFVSSNKSDCPIQFALCSNSLINFNLIIINCTAKIKINRQIKYKKKKTVKPFSNRMSSSSILLTSNCFWLILYYWYFNYYKNSKMYRATQQVSWSLWFG